MFVGMAQQFRLALGQRARISVGPAFLYDRSTDAMVPAPKQPAPEPKKRAASATDSDEDGLLACKLSSNDKAWESGLAFTFQLPQRRAAGRGGVGRGGRGRGRGRGLEPSGHHLVRKYYRMFSKVDVASKWKERERDRYALFDGEIETQGQTAKRI